jgi:hypothetical protein
MSIKPPPDELLIGVESGFKAPKDAKAVREATKGLSTLPPPMVNSSSRLERLRHFPVHWQRFKLV